MSKYPLIMPYLLEKKIKCPEISLLKQENFELSFIDYILIISPFVNKQLDIFLDYFTNKSYGFIEEKPFYYIKNQEYY